MEYKLAPSVFGADFGCLKMQLKELEKAEVEYLHVDVMDGHFVDKMGFGPDHVRMLHQMTSLPLDVHLMVQDPERIIDDIIKAGASMITIHQESTKKLYYCVEKIKSQNVKAGVVLSPATSEETLKYIKDKIDMVLLMTINPGQDGQNFHPEIVNKISNVRDYLGKEIDIEVDGGIDDKNISVCKDAGANVFVSGRYVFKDIEKNIEKLRECLKNN